MKRIGGIAAFLSIFAALAHGAAVQINPADFVAPTVLTLGTPGLVEPPSTYSESGATISSPASFYVYSEGGSGVNVIDLYFVVNDSAFLGIVFTSPTIRFGFDSGDLGTDTPMEPYRVASIEFYSDDSFTNLVDTFSTPVDMTDAGNTFYGLQADTPFRSIRINFQNQTEGGFSPYLDDFRFEGSTVPEPSLFGMVGAIAAIGGILMGRRRKHN